jgi:hypothetical protein
LRTQYIKQGKEGWIPIAQAPCEALSYFNVSLNATVFGEWTAVAPWGLPPPECRENQWSRDNHVRDSTAAAPGCALWSCNHL